MKAHPEKTLISAKQLGLLHVAKSKLALDDETYRDILWRFGQCETGKDLDRKDFDKVLKHFSTLGFHTKSRDGFGTRAGMASPAQVELIRSIWQAIQGEDHKELHLNAWLSKYHTVSAMRFLSAKKAGSVITALKAMSVRKSSPS